MQQASFIGVLKMILILLLIYYGLKVLTRLFGPLLLKYVTKRVGKKFKQQFDQYQQPTSSPKDEVTIDKGSKKNSNNKDLGEYVDFEEID